MKCNTTVEEEEKRDSLRIEERKKEVRIYIECGEKKVRRMGLLEGVILAVGVFCGDASHLSRYTKVTVL